MKKIFGFVLSLVLVIGIILPSAVFAASKTEVIDLFKSISEISSYHSDFENVFADVQITEEQGDSLVLIVEQLKEKVAGKDARPSSYNSDEKIQIMSLFSQACVILGYTYEIVPSEDPQGDGDVVVNLYDVENKLVYTADPSAEPTFVKGDITGDEKVNISDATKLFRIVAKVLPELTGDSALAADVTGDKKVNISDATKLFRFVAKAISTL